MSGESAMESAAAVENMLGEIAGVGRASTGGYQRFAWTREDHTLREWFRGAAEAVGLDVTEDRVGNQWAWWGDPDASLRAGRPGVVTGSHLDSVPGGGNFDGPLGVVAALRAVDTLRRDGFTPARAIGVVNFVDEEGARFGVACAGSRVLTGALSPDHALALTDGDGITLAQALTAAGRDPRALGRDDEALARVGTFVELHIEQGRWLVDEGSAVAVASSIWPHGRWRFDFTGEANHAGTTRLADRDDPALALASLILTAREAAATLGCVATVGKVRVVPNGVNAIPSAATGWLDGRGADEAAVRRLVPMIEQTLGTRAVEESFTSTTRFDPALAADLAGLLGGAPVIGTGAGHDAGVLAAHGVRAAMLFVRNPTGVSHSPAEHAEAADCAAGAAALTTVLRSLAAS
ncbi:allantoate amidohydrolase [Frankia sp. R43]|uniref:allantoate amidohydrolase n=1 Tax=Frankia sp. R43 TaxID=269536 RepID=UPI001F241D30|nr:allantoate amidohydrolase [Frankia sp. R43]